ncbi:hypothetical protein J3R82DRAFT_8665 [Butyriboletus roseoflavus]|nr:hypothetical protein J3R82DRAFT_8665 [Butyriboletus roseoflavus]
MPISRKRTRSPNRFLAPAAKHNKMAKKQPNKKHTSSDSEDSSDLDSASESKSESMSELDCDKLGVDPGDCKIQGVRLHDVEEEAAENYSKSEDEETSLQCWQFLSKMSDETIAQHKHTYGLLICLIPGFKVLIENPSHSAKLKKVIKLVNAIIGETRANDAAQLKDKIPSYVIHNPAINQLLPQIPPRSFQSNLGLNHAVLAGLLCPVESVAAFHENPEVTWKKLKSNNGRQFDNKKMVKGLLRGYFLERVTRHIFTDLSTGLGGDSLGTHPSNLDLHHMDKTEAAQIAYAAVQVSHTSRDKSSFANALWNTWCFAGALGYQLKNLMV